MWDRVYRELPTTAAPAPTVCPTCHCFDIQDETQGDYGRRVRNWDNCMSWLFTMHGTGHNPRGTPRRRTGCASASCTSSSTSPSSAAARSAAWGLRALRAALPGEH